MNFLNQCLLASVRIAVPLFYLNSWEIYANNVPAEKTADTKILKTLS